MIRYELDDPQPVIFRKFDVGLAFDRGPVGGAGARGAFITCCRIVEDLAVLGDDAVKNGNIGMRVSSLPIHDR